MKMLHMHWNSNGEVEYENAPHAIGFTDLVSNIGWGGSPYKAPALDKWLVVLAFGRQLKIGQKCVESRAKMRRQKQKQNWTNHSCMAMWYARHTGSDLGHFCGTKIWKFSDKIVEGDKKEEEEEELSGSWQFYNLIGLPPPPLNALDSGF